MRRANAASLLLAMLVVCLSLRLSAELRVALNRRSFRRSFRQDGDQTKGARKRAASLAGTSTHEGRTEQGIDPRTKNKQSLPVVNGDGATSAVMTWGLEP